MGKTAIRVMEHEPFGDPCPFAEPAWYRGVPTPYYNENHAAFRAKVRAWVDENLIPFVDEWDEAYTCPIEKLRLSAHKAGVLSPWAPEELGGTPPEGGWDEFMFVIWADEMSRCGAGGVAILFFITYMAPLLCRLEAQWRSPRWSAPPQQSTVCVRLHKYLEARHSCAAAKAGSWSGWQGRSV